MIAAVIERRADVAEQQEQHDDDQQRAFEQVRLHRLDGAIDKFGAVIDRRRRRRPAASALRGDFQRLGDGLRDRAAVLAHQHEDRAEHDFAPVLGRGAGAQFLAQ